MQLAVAAHRSADLVLGLQQQDVPARLGQPVGGHQPVVSGADDHRIDLSGQSHPSTLCASGEIQWLIAFSAPAPVSERTSSSL